MLITKTLWQSGISAKRIKFIGLICCGVALFLFSRPPTLAQENEKNVLILNSYHKGFQWSDREVEGIQDVLPAHVTIAVEYMDTKRLADDDYFRLLYQVYKKKYQHTTFDAVVALDNNAFDFALKYHDDLSPNVPIVFGGVNHFDDSMIAGYEHVTGVTENINHIGTIDIILKLHPETEQLLIITDQTTTGIRHYTYLKELEQEGRFPVEFVFLDQGDGPTVAQLLEIVKNAPPNSIVYYSDFFRDSQDNLIRYEEVLPILSEASKVPIYNTGDFYLNYGTVGGKLTSGYYEGKATGDMIARILNDESASDIPIQYEGITKYMFDYKQLARWGIPISDLPQDSIVINTPDSFYYLYRQYIWAALVFIFGQTLAITLLIINITRRKRAEETLKQYSEHLEEMVGERTHELQEAQDQLVKKEWLATLGQLAGSVAHELHNPLGGMRNTVYYLNMALENPSPEVKESLDILEKGIMTSDHIISSLLKFSYPEPAIKRSINLNTLLQEVISQTSIPQDIDVITRTDSSLLPVNADPEQIKEVLDNLIRNAVQAMQPPIGNGGQLILSSALEKDKWVTIAIKDTGIGILPENLKKLFEPLFTTKAKGIGLGLALSKILIEENGGIIEVKSKGVPGQGSTFTIKLSSMKELSNKTV